MLYGNDHTLEFSILGLLDLYLNLFWLAFNSFMFKADSSLAIDRHVLFMRLIMTHRQYVHWSLCSLQFENMYVATFCAIDCNILCNRSQITFSQLPRAPIYVLHYAIDNNLVHNRSHNTNLYWFGVVRSNTTYQAIDHIVKFYFYIVFVINCALFVQLLELRL